MSGKSRFDELLGALADPYRRELLLALIKQNPQDDDDLNPLNIHPQGTDEFSQVNIFMGHLPRLDKMGIIDWDQDKDQITKGEDWGEFEPLLRLIAENKDELPKEWFKNADSE